MKAFCLAIVAVVTFAIQLVPTNAYSLTLRLRRSSPFLGGQNKDSRSDLTAVRSRIRDQLQTKRPIIVLSYFCKNLDTLDSIGLRDVALTAGFGRRIKSLHNPMTYLGITALSLLRWNSLGRNPFYWFAVAFCVKWYRARYVFNIPVWDRQPNWNNVITSKEQEKDLKAFTCKKCGSTIFIAKSREFFFQGSTGIGGLGCFNCGAKGKENFIMDRDRIVEDVGDMDDYFEYERPLDFVSRAERRKILKEAKGDEEKANQILLERAAASEEGTSTNNVELGTNVHVAKAEPKEVGAQEKRPSTPSESSRPNSQPLDSSKSETDKFKNTSSADDDLDTLGMDQ